MTFADILPSLLFASGAIVASLLFIVAPARRYAARLRDRTRALLARAAGHEIATRKHEHAAALLFAEGHAFVHGVYRAAPPLALPFAPTRLSVRPVADDAAPPAVRPPRTVALPSSGVVVAMFGEEPLPPRDTEPGEPWDDVESGRRPCIRPEPLSPLRLPALRPLDDGARVSPVTPRGPQS